MRDRQNPAEANYGVAPYLLSGGLLALGGTHLATRKMVNPEYLKKRKNVLSIMHRPAGKGKANISERDKLRLSRYMRSAGVGVGGTMLGSGATLALTRNKQQKKEAGVGASFNSPMGRYLLGGAATGAAAGAYAGGEENRGKGALIGALAGGFGGGALGDVIARSKINKLKKGDRVGVQRTFESPDGTFTNRKRQKNVELEYQDAAYEGLADGKRRVANPNRVNELLQAGVLYEDIPEITRSAAIRNTNIAQINKVLDDADIKRLQGVAKERGARATTRALTGGGIGAAGLGAAAYNRRQQEKEAHVFRKLAEKQEAEQQARASYIMPGALAAGIGGYQLYKRRKHNKRLDEQEKSAALYANYRRMRGY